MKLELYKKTKGDVLYLDLEAVDDDLVTLVVKDSDGDHRGTILSIGPDGVILETGLNDVVDGFDCDKDGRIKVIK